MSQVPYNNKYNIQKHCTYIHSRLFILIKKPCKEVNGFTPVQAQCRIKNSQKPWYIAEKFIEKCYGCTAKGIVCSNEAQGCGKNEVCCPDYEIKFLCYKG